jgi:LPPG:FO 2-phospho-L-lactate transferase
VRGFIFQDCDNSTPAPGLLDRLDQADAVIICPSNPFISIGPILAIPGIEDTLRQNKSKVLAISPIIAGRAIKGPTARMLQQLGMEVSALGIARMYQHLAGNFVLDNNDRDLREPAASLGMRVFLAQTLMDTPASKMRLAKQVLETVR